jgi:PAS domain S-box-containing protein
MNDQDLQHEVAWLRQRVADLEELRGEHEQEVYHHAVQLDHSLDELRRHAQDLARAKEALRKSRERFELAVQGSGAGLWDWDVETGVVYFSPLWKSMLGYAEDELEGNFADWEQLLHPEDRERALATLKAYVDGVTPTYELEHRLRHKDGSYRWILARGVALRDATGRPYRMAGSHTDITARKQAEQALRDSEALYHSLVETLPLNVFRKDRQGRFTFGNQRFAESLGRPLDEILGKTDYAFFPPELAAKYQADDQKVLATGQVFEDVEEHYRPDGTKIYVQVLKAPVFDSHGQIVGTESIFWDVTARKLAEEALQQAKAEAEAASRAKSEFLTNISHEIRTPMNAILGMTELVLDTPLTVEQRDCLSIVQKSAESLLGVINDILDFSKIEAGKLDLDERPFQLRDCLGDALITLALRAHQQGLELIYHVAPNVPDALQGDSGRLRQVLLNLVGNAIKFTERGEVLVRVGLESSKASEAAPASTPLTTHLHFEVSDTGIGIPAEKQQMIFAPFVQVDGSTTRRYGGTGLGLAIAARLVELMRGHIWVESGLGQGSTFHFSAQFGVCPELIPPPTGDVVQLRGLPVLIVDDNATNRLILEETLLHWMMKPTAVANAAAALEVLRSASAAGQPFALVLLDSHMPEMDGFALARQIRHEPNLARATVMMLTSSEQPGDVARCRESGIASYLVKPVRQAELWRALLAALGAVPELQRQDRSAVPAPNKGRPLRVLLVEDNLVNQKLALRLLQKRDHSVTVAANGKEALALLDQNVFDLILMDVQMPEMDGFQATAAIRRRERGTARRLPILAMTAYAMKGDQERCLAAGMDGYISKPVRVQELYDAIERLASDAPSPRPPQACREEESVDWASSLEYVGGDRQLLKDLMEVFLQTCPEWLEEVRTGLARQDAAQVQRAAHKLKGTLGNFGAQVAFDAALQIELQCRTGSLQGVEEIWGLLAREMDRLLPVLKAWCQEGPTAVADNGDRIPNNSGAAAHSGGMG